MIFFVKDETFEEIADAIRRKTGTTNKITPLQMPDKILSIISGEGGSTPSGPDDPTKNYLKIELLDFSASMDSLSPNVTIVPIEISLEDTGVMEP